MMPKLSINAQKSFDAYLHQVRLLLQGVKSIDIEEIVQNINEHIENELADVTEPVDTDKLEDVLKKLGSPQQWVPEEEIQWWKKIILRLRSGPEDWRLAYLSFVLLISGFLFPPAFIILLPASFIVSRAFLSVKNRNDELQGQKWLIYPSLIIICIILLFIILAWPIIPISIFWVPAYTAILNEHGIDASQKTVNIVTIQVCAESLGAIWIGYGLLLLKKKYQKLIKLIFKPFADNFNRKWDMLLIFMGVVLIVLGMAVKIVFI